MNKFTAKQISEQNDIYKIVNGLHQKISPHTINKISQRIKRFKMNKEYRNIVKLK